jgi:hypothetical protein
MQVQPGLGISQPDRAKTETKRAYLSGLVMLAASPFTFAVYTKERKRIRRKIEKLFRRWVQPKQVQ